MHLSVAAVAGAVATGLADLPPRELLASATLAGLMGAVALSDIQRMTVPDMLSVLTALTGIAWLPFLSGEPGGDLVRQASAVALQMILCGGAFLLVREGYYRIRGSDGLGMGDVKLAAAAGAWIDWEAFAIATFVASAGVLLFAGAAAVAFGSWPREQRIPLAAYLAPVIWLTWLAGRI